MVYYRNGRKMKCSITLGEGEMDGFTPIVRPKIKQGDFYVRMLCRIKMKGLRKIVRSLIFSHRLTHSLNYARFQKEQGAKIVGIMCEYTPRELIMAAGGIPVCLCGGSAEMVEACRKRFTFESLSIDQINIRL